MYYQSRQGGTKHLPLQRKLRSHEQGGYGNQPFLQVSSQSYVAYFDNTFRLITVPFFKNYCGTLKYILKITGTMIYHI